jgi:hypothetical protein
MKVYEEWEGKVRELKSDMLKVEQRVLGKLTELQELASIPRIN